MQAEQKGLEAQKNDAFGQITDQANRRGLFYSGIPVAEEQKYTGASYLPAVANLKSRYAQQRFNLQDALAQITKDQYGQAYGLRNQELDREAAARAAASSGGGGGGGGYGSPSLNLGGGQDGGYGFKQRADKGFSFVGPNGQPISAAVYAANTNTPFRDLLQEMANKGDAGARQALQFVGNDARYDPSKIGLITPYRSNNKNTYNSLTWGAGIQNG